MRKDVVDMEQNNYVIYGEPYEFEDVILCAFRYAITRHTYVVGEILDWIKDNSHLMDGNKRMYDVLLRDLRDRLYEYENTELGMPEYARIDYTTLSEFEEWLLEFGKGYGWN